VSRKTPLFLVAGAALLVQCGPSGPFEADDRGAAPLGAAPPAGSRSPEPSSPALPPPPAACPSGWTCDREAWERAPRPTITEILVQKEAHRLHLLAGKVIVRSYSVAIGSGGAGPKRFEGDNVTPVGTYAITDRIKSPWHTFLGVNYPNLEDQRRFAERRGRGEVPFGRGIGFGIAIHGRRQDMADELHKEVDWTRGCVALDNDEIDEVASVVKRGTRLVITD
jgi:lipoprotein-anchoring transpeptidase ErfK/SrfK